MSGRPPLQSVDAADRALKLRLLFLLGPPVLLFLALAEFFLFARGAIGPKILVLLLVLDLPAAAGVVWTCWRMISGGATGLAQVLYAGGNLARDPEHSGEESLIARGFYREAEAALRRRLGSHPEDHAARFKLADLYHRHLDDPAAAERLWMDIRRSAPTPKQEMLLANLLIEHYRRTGRRDRLMVELGRFAERWRGTRAAEDAARALKDLKAEGLER
jgi:hypothetical protein